jgi:pheromone shutdown-related protein TraB
MIYLIGTGHVFDLSSALLKIFDEKSPDVLCVELDKQRYKALMLKQKNPEEYKKIQKNVPIIYKLLSRFQEGMAKEYGVVAGEEMLTTINYANTHNLPVAFIDMNAQNMFSRMLKTMSFSEKFKLLFSGFGGLFVNKKRVEKELSKIEKNYDKYLLEIGEKFPTIKKVLIDERDQHMVNQLTAASSKYENVIAVIGDGHIPGITELLKKKEIDFETIRLNELRNIKKSDYDSSSATFSMQYKDPL